MGSRSACAFTIRASSGSTAAALQPNVLGVSVAVIGGDDRLRLSNYSGKTIVILGARRRQRRAP